MINYNDFYLKNIEENMNSFKEIINNYCNEFSINILYDKDKIYIFYLKNLPIGYVSFRYENNKIITNINIFSLYRGNRYSYILLELLEKILIQDNKTIDYIVITIKNNNIASIIRAEKEGYIKFKEDKDLFYYQKEINKVYKTLINTHKFSNKLNMCLGGGGVYKIVLLTNNFNAIPLLKWLKSIGENVTLYSQKISLIEIKNMNIDFIIIYNYNYIISEDIINYLKNGIINMHISLLPYNKGSSPNLWSFIDNTPKGVTIHYVDKNLDTGNILFQKEIKFDDTKETLISTYNKLNDEIKELFYNNWHLIKTKKLNGKRQSEIGIGSYHNKKDLIDLRKKLEFSWSDNIRDLKIKYNNIN